MPSAPESAALRVSAPASQTSLLRRLTLLDTMMLLVGGIVGSAIFLTPRDVAQQLASPGPFLLVWFLGGVVSLLACFAFAEMGAMFPEAGGQYVYLREAFGDFVAFLYGWMVFTVYSTGSVAALSVGFATYFGVMVPVVSEQHAVANIGDWTLTRAHLVALAVNFVLTWVNVAGVKRAAILQNVASWAKFLAMAAFVIFGFALGRGSLGHFTAASSAAPGSTVFAFGVALIAVFWAYDGWIYPCWAAGEVEKPHRNLPLALILGILIVAAVYMSMNAVYVYALSVPAIAAGETTTARAAAAALFSPSAGLWISALIALSCFGALSSCILGGARVYYAMAQDGVFFRRMAGVHPRYHTPAFSLWAQALWGGALTLSGRYDQLFTYLMFMGMIGYGLAVAGLFVLRHKHPDLPRPYRCTGYPWLPGLYVAFTALWSLNTLWYRPKESLAGIGIVLLGVPCYLYWRRNQQRIA